MATVEKKAARFQLMAELQDGEHQVETPDAVEALFADRGLTPGNDSPASERFDPSKEPGWTLPMALAWIAWRKLDAVTEQWETFRETQFEWHHIQDNRVWSWQLEPV